MIYIEECMKVDGIFTILIMQVVLGNATLLGEFIKENGGEFSITNGHLVVSATPLELIATINYMCKFNDPFNLCNTHGIPIGEKPEVIKELNKKNRNLQINEILK